jgi:hypothetical protein
MIDFPASPILGQSFVDPTTNLQWVWDGTKWKAAGIASPPLPIAMNDNRLINGDMRVDQRNNGASGTAYNVYTVDRWQYAASQASKGTWQRFASASYTGFPYSLLFTSSSAYTPLATDIFCIVQYIEADMVSDLQWGTPAAQPVTLSFWAYSSLTGTFSGSIGNYAGTRAYPFTFSLPTANTWTKIAVTIPGDTAGTWVMSGNAGSVTVYFDLGSGANYRAPANAWASGNHAGVNGAVSVVSTNGAQFLLTGVKLEVGSVATPFNRQSLAKTLADCQRYYSTASAHLLMSATIANQYVCATAVLPVTMRTTPTLAVNFFTGIPDNQINPPNIDGITVNSFRIYTTSTAAGLVQCSRTMTASAEL